MTIWHRISISCYLLTKNTKTMREELRKPPKEITSYEYLYLATIKKLNNGEYLAPEHRASDIKGCMRFQELTPGNDYRTLQDIAYSNDRYRQMWQVLDHCFIIPPIQPPRWFRSEENEINIVYVRLTTEKYTCKTYDSAMFYALGITAKSPMIPIITYSKATPEAFDGKAIKTHHMDERLKFKDVCPKSLTMERLKEQSTLSDQDLEDLANSKITFGLTKDNIAHIESSLAAKDWDATYAHYFWVQMGKDCNWEPLTLALYYFRYLKLKREIEGDDIRLTAMIIQKKPNATMQITPEFLLSMGFKELVEKQTFSKGHIGLDFVQGSWKVSYMKKGQNYIPKNAYVSEIIQYEYELLKIMYNNPIEDSK